MKTKIISTLLIFSMSCLFSATCRNKEDVELLRSNLNSAINEFNPFETARLLDKLAKAGVDRKTLPITEATDLILGKVDYSDWESITGDELIQLCGPLEGMQNGTWAEHPIRAYHFWGLMEIGERKKGLELWKKSEKQIDSLWKSPYLRFNPALSKEDHIFRQNLENAICTFLIGFVASKEHEDKLFSIELAKKQYDWYQSCLKKTLKGIQSSDPAVQSRLMQIMADYPYLLLEYCLVEAGLAMDPSANPFLKDQPKTNIHFELVERAGFKGCTLGGYNRIALGDYDNDGYADVLVPNQGLWRNLGGSGKFTRVDKELGLDIKGTLAAFADVNNDGLIDVIVAGKNKFGVSLQTKGRIFRPLIKPANRVPENPVAIGLFDGDDDGLIDVYLASREKDEVGKTEVLRNRGDGTFEDVANAWGFSGDDTMPPGEGVSPGDYDNDGYTDIYVSNYTYPLNRNTLWHNISEKGKTIFAQCASAPWFGRGKRPEVLEGFDRGVEGRHSINGGETHWGFTSGSVWGDLNGDGTLDLVCANLVHERYFWIGSFSDISRVYLNTGNAFQDHTLNAGLVFRETNSDPLLADFNNDGHLDLSMTNEYRPFVNQIYEGVGDASFNEVTFRTGAFACNASGQAAADFDNDGDLDWFVYAGNRGLLLYENRLIDRGNIPARANWIEIKLHSAKHVNSMSYGARVTVRANGRIYVREVAGMRGYSCCDDQVVHVGLGEYAGKVNIEIRWIGDRIQRVSGLDANKRHEIYEADEKESK